MILLIGDVQLEGMMSAVRHESATLESMKSQIKEMDAIKKQIPVLQEQLAAADEKTFAVIREKDYINEKCVQLQADLQRLNDMYNNERKQNLEAQERQLGLDQELNLCKLG